LGTSIFKTDICKHKSTKKNKKRNGRTIMKTKRKDGYTVIHSGRDARGGKYWLVHDPDTGGSKYIWKRGHVWAGFQKV
jgi:hypothetical protein